VHGLDPATLDAVQAALGPAEADAFMARLEHVWPDICEPLGQVYGDRTDLGAFLGELIADAIGAAAARPAQLRRLDRRREIDQAWFQRSRLIGLRLLRGLVRGDADRRRRTVGLPGRARCHLTST
jgi:amylosucrase